ncbi:MAG: hypothetical protein MRY74_17345 [Neomegalonema sp.]|nr:hypothetical protein [Neomegalonema sp.]
MSDTSERAGAFTFVWIVALIIGGLIATAAFEFYARGVSPIVFAAESAPKEGVAPQPGFAKIVADAIGAKQVPGLQVLEPSTVIRAAANKVGVAMDAKPLFGGAKPGACPGLQLGDCFSADMANILSLAAGVLGLPLLYMLIIRPIFGAIGLPWLLSGLVFGALAFVLATYVLHVVVTDPKNEMMFGLLAGKALGVSWLIADLIYGVFLALFTRIIAGR